MEIQADVRKIEKIIERDCQNSSFYDKSSWVHCLRTAKIARSLAMRNGGSSEIAYLGGLLHDLGSVRYGRENHHLTGARDAVSILKGFDFLPFLIAKVAHCVYAHRGSQKIKPKTVEAICVAAADAINHFEMVEELLEAACGILGKNSEEAREWLTDKFKKDWEKIAPEIKPLVEANYKEACLKLQGP